MDFIKKMGKKELAMIAVAITFVAIVAYFLLKGKGKEAKVAEANDNVPPSDNPLRGAFPSGQSPYDYDYTIEQETTSGLIPSWAGGDGSKQKKKLSGREEFDRKAKAIMDQIAGEKPDGDWYKLVEKSTGEYWSSVAGMNMGQAIYQTAREFIGAKFYY